MSSQSYKNHIRFYAPHHFVFYPISLCMLVLAFLMSSKMPELKYIWWFLAALTILITWLSFMLRQHYALTLQNRIIRLEVSHRYFVLSGKDFSLLEPSLNDAQIFALRFVSNDEFLPLLEQTMTTKMPSSDIKKSIKIWKADNYRV